MEAEYAEVVKRILEPPENSACRGVTTKVPRSLPVQPTMPAPSPKPIPERTVSKPAEDSEFQEVRRRRRQNRRGIVGTGEQQGDSGLRAAEEELFLYRVSCDTTCQDILDYIDRMNKKKSLHVTVKKLVQMSHAESYTKSFKMTLSSVDFSTMMQGSMWPPRVQVRRFIRPRRL